MERLTVAMLRVEMTKLRMRKRERETEKILLSN